MRRSTESEPQPLFVDTWGWLVLEDSKHSAHAAVHELRQAYAHAGVAWVTTDYVLDETITRLFSRRPFDEARQFCAGVFRAQESGALQLETITPQRFAQAYRLRLRYRDKPRVSFTDLTSFVVMKELGIQLALTEDAHFTQVQMGFQVLPKR
ncbi:MAG: type II toxin-antitoxin system VapC family toxin [Gammaproteobacteria bacterium]